MRRVVYYNSSGVSIDADALAFINAIGTADSSIISAINQLTIEMKSNNIWSKMKAIYPFVGGTANTHKYNLKDPRDLDEAHRITWEGSVNHFSDGMKGNGGYGNTNRLLEGLQDRGGLSVYILDDYTENSDAIGVRVSQTISYIIPNWTGNIMYARHHSTTNYSKVTLGAKGFYATSRLNDTGNQAVVVNVKGDNEYSDQVKNTNPYDLNYPFFIGARNYEGTAQSFSTHKISCATIHNNMNGGDLIQLKNIITTFQQNLGRL